MITNLKQWVIARAKERTSWDGAVLIAMGICFLIVPASAKFAGLAAIIYGAWTLWKKEQGVETPVDTPVEPTAEQNTNPPA
jgi:hypothetical protein